MKNANKQPTIKGAVAVKDAMAVGKQRSYNEVVEFLDSNWAPASEKMLASFKQLDQAFGNLSQKQDTILVTGTNGKSLTINYAAKLLKEEGISVGAFYAPHFLTYNERFGLNNEQISSKTFTDLANEVINTAETLGLKPSSYEILTMMALLHFSANNTDVVLLEVDESVPCHITTLFNPKIAAVTRATPDGVNPLEQVAVPVLHDILSVVKPNTHVISADQSKLNLQVMLDIVKDMKGIWCMPIRKLAMLAYPFEQLQGRCAALAERIAYIYVNTFANKDAIVVTSSLLCKQKGQRGRPTLEAKRQSELNPKKTVEHFWKEVQTSMPCRFQLLDKEKPSILLDNADNLDAFKNLLLGIRLLHYQRPLKGLTLVIGCNNPKLDLGEFLKLLRYFFKKTSGSVIICPAKPVPGTGDAQAWDIEMVANACKSMKIKAKACKSFESAFEAARKLVDERNGLVVVAGSPSVVAEYWHYKGIKKL